MNDNVLIELAKVIGYPIEEITDNGTRHVFAVDGYEVTVENMQARKLRFSIVLDIAGDNVIDLLKYATGRFLKESATLAYDSEKKVCFLWDEIPLVSDDDLKKNFSVFLDSCDWWRGRVKELAEQPVKASEMMIMP